MLLEHIGIASKRQFPCAPTTYVQSINEGFHYKTGLSQTSQLLFRGFIKRREAGIFPFYSGMFPLLLLINLYRVNRQILSNHPPTST